MALQLNVSTTPLGIGFTNAYARIAMAAISRQRTEDPKHVVMMDVVIYATTPSSPDQRDVDFKRLYAPLDEVEVCAGATFLAKCYGWLMASKEFAGSTEV